MAELLDGLIPDPARREEAARRVHPIETDLSADDPHFGEALRRAIDGLPARVIHGAASVAFDLPLAEARRINLDGTRRMLEAAAALADAGLLTRFALRVDRLRGRAAGRNGLRARARRGAGFTNTYERTKRDAEQLVREWQGRLPLTVLRPSIVAGRAATGETSHFRVLYWPLKVLARGLVVCIPAERDAVLDIVPVDFVVDAMLHILEREDSLGGCYHLTAGAGVTIEEIVRLTTEIFELGACRPTSRPAGCIRCCAAARAGARRALAERPPDQRGLRALPLQAARLRQSRAPGGPPGLSAAHAGHERLPEDDPRLREGDRLRPTHADCLVSRAR